MQNEEKQIRIATTKEGTLVQTTLSKTPHMVLVGRTSSGTTSTLRSLTKELCVQYTPDELHLYISDAKGTGFKNYQSVPHVVDDIATRLEDAVTQIKGVHQELERRQKTNKNQPIIVLAIDEIDTLAKGESALEDWLDDLLTHGAKYGIHVMMTVKNASHPLMTKHDLCRIYHSPFDTNEKVDEDYYNTRGNVMVETQPCHILYTPYNWMEAL